MSQSRENKRTDGKTDGRADTPYFVGFYRTLPAEAGGPKRPLKAAFTEFLNK